MGDGFDHITVTPAEDADEVIVAGAAGVGAAAGPGAGQAALAPAAAEDGPAAEGAPPASPAPSPALAAAAESSSPPSPARPSDPASRRSPARGDAYRETTLADLEGPGMPFAQKVVIVAAVVCIIGALCYYFAVMR